MGMAWMTAHVEWRRRWGSLALLALLVTLAGGVTMGAVAAARRADTAFQRFVDSTGDPEIQADGFANPTAWSSDQTAASAAFDAAVAVPGVVRGDRMAAVAVAATEEADAFSFAIVEQRGEPANAFMVEGRMFDPAEPHEVVVNEAGSRAFGVGVGDSLVLGTVGWDQLEDYLAENGIGDERTGPRIEVTVTGIQRAAFDIAQQDDPFITLGPAFVEQYGDQVIHCMCIDVFDAAPGRADEAVAGLARLYEPYGFDVEFEEQGALPEHAANGIDVEVAAMRLLAIAAGLATVIVVGQAIARQAAASAEDRAIASALGASTGQQTLAGVLAIVPAIIAGSVGSVLVAVALSALTPRGFARRAEVDPGVRIDAFVLTLGTLAVLAVGVSILVAATWRSVRPRSAGTPRFVGLPSGVGPAGLLGIALATRPGRRGRVAAGGAIVATAMGVAGTLGVWSFEAGRDHLLSEARLYGVDADLAWGGAPEDAERAVDVATSSPGVDSVGVHWALDADVELTGPGGSATGNPERVRRRRRLGRPDGRPRPCGRRARRGRARAPRPRRARRRPRRCRAGRGLRRRRHADRRRGGDRVGPGRGRRWLRDVAERAPRAEPDHVRWPVRLRPRPAVRRRRSRRRPRTRLAPY